MNKGSIICISTEHKGNPDLEKVCYLEVVCPKKQLFVDVLSRKTFNPSQYRVKRTIVNYTDVLDSVRKCITLAKSKRDQANKNKLVKIREMLNETIKR